MALSCSPYLVEHCVLQTTLPPNLVYLPAECEASSIHCVAPSPHAVQSVFQHSQLVRRTKRRPSHQHTSSEAGPPSNCVHVNAQSYLLCLEALFVASRKSSSTRLLLRFEDQKPPPCVGDSIREHRHALLLRVDAHLVLAALKLKTKQAIRDRVARPKVRHLA